MGFALTNEAIDKYFGFLAKLDNKSKKRLIIKLTESIDTKEENISDLRIFMAPGKTPETQTKL